MTGRNGRRIALAVMVATAVAAFGVFWAVPNMAGTAFVHVRAIAEVRNDGAATAGTGGTSTTGAGAALSSVIIGGSPAVRAAALVVAVEVSNSYPLSVVLGTGPVPFQAAVYRRGSDGKLTRIWQASGYDPTLEEGSDSPMGGSARDGAAVITPGTTRHSITSATAPFSLTDSTGAPLPAGVYYLRVWAYGIGSPLLPLALDGGVDPLGTPTELPSAG